MAIKKILLAVGGVFLGGMGFYAGIILGSMVASSLGMVTPAMPSGIDPDKLMLYTFLTGFILAGMLALLSPRIAGGFLTRWLILALLLWIVYGVNTFLEANIVTTMSSPFIVVMYIPASLLGAAFVAWLSRQQIKVRASPT